MVVAISLGLLNTRCWIIDSLLCKYYTYCWKSRLNSFILHISNNFDYKVLLSSCRTRIYSFKCNLCSWGYYIVCIVHLIGWKGKHKWNSYQSTSTIRTYLYCIGCTNYWISYTGQSTKSIYLLIGIECSWQLSTICTYCWTEYKMRGKSCKCWQICRGNNS